MKKYKIVVYAIAKNEAKYADAWAKNMSEADEIYVLLDPTSNDNTKEILLKNGVHVKEKSIVPWRFDKARNESLKLVPKDADICVCTDLDELFNPGWRKILEDSWKEDTNQALYLYHHNASSVNATPNIFTYSKIHDRNTFVWKWVVHEYIVSKKKKSVNSVFLEGVMLKHYPDPTKVREYTKLLEYGVNKEKEDPRYLTLLLKDYTDSKRYDDAKKIVDRLLNLKKISKIYLLMTYKNFIKIKQAEGKYDEAISLCYLALSKNIKSRHFYAELGSLLILQKQEYRFGIECFNKCLKLDEDSMPGIETEWKSKAVLYNMISVGYYYLKDFDKAIEAIDEALLISPNEQAYKGNKELYVKMKNQEKEE